MADGRGGKRAGAGRKTKAETLQLDKLLDECVSDADIKELFCVLVKNGKRGNINAIMALLAYRYGKPLERHEHSGNDEKPIKIILEYRDHIATPAPASGATDDQAASAAL